MAAETYTYFKPDPNLRSAYGGAAIQAGGDSAEITAATLCQRYICEQLGLPSGHTQYLFRQGVATDTFTWIRVSDYTYSAISGYLTATELGTVTTTAPAGWTISSTLIPLQPHPSKINIIARMDSIGDGLGTTNGKKDTHLAKALTILSPGGETPIFSNNDREAETSTHKLINLSLGGSNYNDTVGNGSGSESYPLNETLAFLQRTLTIPDSPRTIFIYGCTNDLPYDLSKDPSTVVSDVDALITQLKAAKPSWKFGIQTHYKRSENSTLNGRINTLNGLWRSQYASLGFDFVLDFEALVPVVNISTGDTTDTLYYTDGTHLTSLTHGPLHLAPVAADAIEAIQATF